MIFAFLVFIQKLDTFYLDQGLKEAFGYLRTVVVLFEKGSAITGNPAITDGSYVKAIVQHQFKPAFAPTLERFRAEHEALLTSKQGKLNEDTNGDPQLEVTPSSTIERKFGHYINHKTLITNLVMFL